MTTFHVDIYFLGLFAVVLDPDAKGKKLALVVPRTDLGAASKRKDPAQDGGELRRHRWFVEFNPNQVSGSAGKAPRNALAHWNLSRRKSFHRLTFESDAQPLAIGTALNYVCDFAKVAPAYADLPARHLEWPPAAGNAEVAGQIMFAQGELAEPPSVLWQEWSFPGTLAKGTIHSQDACHFLHLHLKDVSRFTIRVRENDADTGQTLSFQATPKRPVKITICNLCDVNPLRWRTAGAPRVDDDYRWFYQVIDDPSNQIKGDLQGLALPVPHPSGYQNAQGQNCLETKFNPQKFDLDQRFTGAGLPRRSS